MLRIPFQLRRPYISKDERDFYLLENPLRKEKVFQVPMVAATSWKGALRATLWQLGYKEENEVTIRLLGNPRGSEEGQAGRLYFYPTFFDKIGLEVINPHNRETGVGERGPILMECVLGGIGTLLLLYVPFGPIEHNERERRVEVAQDLVVLAEGLRAMLTTYGFGAKTSSGFGTADDELATKGTLALSAELPGMVTSTAAPQVPEPPKLDLPRYLESLTRLHAEFRKPDGSLKSEAEYEAFVKSRGGQYSKKDKQLYEKAQKWWEREGRQLAEATTQQPAPEPSPVPIQTLPVTELTFTSLSELRELAQRVAAQLRNGDER
jgi:CRISPR-associated protein Cmr2